MTLKDDKIMRRHIPNRMPTALFTLPIDGRAVTGEINYIHTSTGVVPIALWIKLDKTDTYLDRELRASGKLISRCLQNSESLAWLLNLRGKDNPNSPIPNSKKILSKKKKIIFFSCPKKIFKKKKNKLYKNFIFCEYKNFSKIINNLKGKGFCIDELTCSISNEKIIKSRFKVKCYTDPCYEMKSIKNNIEIKHTINAHIEDGLALTKFIYWIKNKNKKRITEIDAQNKLESFRKKNKNYLYPSFDTIAGSGKNGAIVHYRAKKQSCKTIKKKDIFLCDSGGQYKYGTTDVTRTISLLNSNKRIKNIFTRVLKGHIAVTSFNLKKNTSGSIIDKKARKYLKQINLDYAHGTGHGVGYFLNVHEGPHAISKGNNVNFKEGMVVSNEPGYYEKSNFGIRIENLIYVRKSKNKNQFDNLTMVPIDKDLMDFKILNKKERDWINNYHEKVFNNLKKIMNKNEILELKKACSAI